MSTRICLFGPTGSGKSTIARHLASRYGAEVISVAEPLHRLQDLIYGFLRMDVAGQDGELLQFLAQKIEREQPGWLVECLLQRRKPLRRILRRQPRDGLHARSSLDGTRRPRYGTCVRTSSV